MLSYWYDIIIEDINHYPFSFFLVFKTSSSKPSLHQSLQGWSLVQPPRSVHWNISTRLCLPSETAHCWNSRPRTNKGPKQDGFSQRFGMYRQISLCFFNTKKQWGEFGYLVQWIYMVQENFIVFARNYYTKWTLKQSVLQWYPCTLRPNVVCEKNHSPAWIWFGRGLGDKRSA